MTDRTIVTDLIGRDRSLGRTLDNVGDKADRAGRRFKALQDESAKAGGAGDKLAGKLKGLASTAAGVAVTGAKVTSAVATLGAVAVPTAVAVGKTAVAVGKLAAEAAPAAAALVPLAAGAALVKATVVSAGPAMLEQISPVTKAWETQQKRVGDLASKGLRPLAAEFVRLNMPSIAKAQDRIAVSLNNSATFATKWANSTRGQQVIKSLTQDTAAAFERLEPSVTAVGISLANMAGRVSGVAFQRLGAGAEYALDKVNAVIDGISARDVEDGFLRIESAGRAIADAGRAVGDAWDWVQENEVALSRFADVLSVVGIVGGLASGPTGWALALASAGSLTARHWDDAGPALDRAGGALQRLGEKKSVQDTLDRISGAWDRISAAGERFVDRVEPKLGPFLDRVEDAFIKLQPTIGAVASVVGIAAAAWLDFAGVMTGVWIDAVGIALTAAANLSVGMQKQAAVALGVWADIVDPLAGVARALGLPFADSLQGIADGARSAAGRTERSLNAVKTDLAQQEIGRLQTKVSSLKGKTVKTEADRKAIADSEARIRQLQGTVDGLRGKTVTALVKTTYLSVFRSEERRDAAYASRRAAGGPVRDGEPYVVGEFGRELFVPDTGGTIVPAAPTRQALEGGGSTAVTVNLNLTLAGPVIGRQAQRELADVLVDALHQGVRSGTGKRIPRAAISPT